LKDEGFGRRDLSQFAFPGTALGCDEGRENAQFPVFSVGRVVYIRGLFHSAHRPGRGFHLPGGQGIGWQSAVRLLTVG